MKNLTKGGWEEKAVEPTLIKSGVYFSSSSGNVSVCVQQEEPNFYFQNK